MPIAKINGIDLYYEVHGDGPPVLFIHGLGSSSWEWSNQVNALKDRYQCIIYDVRGHGKTSKPAGKYTPAMHASDAFALIDFLNIAALPVVGFSMGGFITFQMAVDAPQRLTSMAIINSGPLVPSSSLKDKLNILQRLVLFRLLSMEKIGEIFGKRLFPDPDQGELRELIAMHFAKNDKRAYLDATLGLVGWTVVQHLPSIRIPTLMLTGDLDYTTVEMKKSYFDQMPDVQMVVIPKARHYMSMDHADEVNAALEAFLSKTLQAEKV